MSEESDITGEITAEEINAYLEGDAPLDGLDNAFEKILELMKNTKQAEAKLIITIKNDILETSEDEDE